MTKLVYLLFISLFSMGISAQDVNVNSDAINTCTGAINIFENGAFTLQFTGKKSESSIDNYPSLIGIERENQLWCSYIAATSGELNFTASKKTGFLQMVIFSEEMTDICGELKTATAEIKRLHLGKEDVIVGLQKEVSDGIMYSLKLKAGQKIQLLFSTEAKLKDEMILHWDFTVQKEVVAETKIVDRRNDEFSPTFRILVRDKGTNIPLVANLSIEGSREIDAMYTGSDFFFNLSRNCKLTIKCDVEGYFFDDRIEEISAFEDHEVIILLEIISSGKSIKIEEIEFTPGTSDIVASSEPKLRRLKDFLALNADINIEIQGHVFATGDNSFAGQKMSEARAKRVMKYLIDNGVDKNRLSSVGYGNTKPIYAEPKLFYEEQANRRVEILVK